jgi:2-methylisocitrate lyase-like PEP mutase family enzyme
MRNSHSNNLTGPNAGDEFRRRIQTNRLLPLIGVYDVFSALIASESFEGVFCSGYSYAASAYGLPDVGYVNWRDMTDWATKVRHAIPNT